jgi:tripartite ATP-independent transporter DctP family solute receptor
MTSLRRSNHESVDTISRRDALKDAALGMAAIAGGVLPAGAAKADTVTMSYGSDSPISAPHTKSALVMKQLIEARTSGRIQVAIFPDSQLGEAGPMLNSIKAGSLDAVSIDVGHLSIAAPELDVCNLPFLFKSGEQAVAFLNSPTGLKLWPKIKEAFACEVLGWAQDGSSDFLTSKRAIRTPADVAGLKFGLGASKVQRDFILALGGIPSGLENHAYYTALQTGLIDALTRSPMDILSFRFYQVTKYLSLTRHVSPPNALVVSNKFMAKLSPRDREIVRAAAKPAVDAQMTAALNAEKTALAFLQKHGIQIIQLENLKAFADKMEVVYMEEAPRIGADIIEAARKFVAA